jgi:hypothetical protein
MKDKMREGQKETKKEWSNPITAQAAPEPQALSPHPTATSLGRKLPNISGRQEVHHHVVALFYGKLLRDLQMSASAPFPAHHLSHHLP